MTRDTLLVTGSRDWADVDTIRAWLRPYTPIPQQSANVFRLVHGDARGADLLAARVANSLGFVVEAYRVDERIDGPWPAAGIRRNARMVAAEAQRVRLVFAFSWWQTDSKKRSEVGLSPGTADCVSRCVQAGLSVVLVAPGSRP